jgi:hypothetical protein
LNCSDFFEVRAEIVRLAVRKSKQRGKQKRSTRAPKDSGHNNSIIRDGDPQDAPTGDASSDADAPLGPLR